MKVSEAIRKNIFHLSVGNVLNKRGMLKRRNTFFFEEIGAEYIAGCERKGYSKNIMMAGKKWMTMFFDKIIPQAFKIAPVLFLNTIIRNLWISGGLMDDFSVSRRDKTVSIETKGEGLTRIVGRNGFMIGFYQGVINGLFGCETEPVRASQSRKKCKYVFRLTARKITHFRTKEKSEYNKLNHIESGKGVTLKDLLEKKIIILKNDNRFYFREKPISAIESTLFHILGNDCIMPEEISRISYDFFRDIIKAGSSEKKLYLIKMLLQAMGWGVINIVVKDNEVTFDIRNPPYGLQKDEDNWDFLAHTILGYLWTMNRDFRISETMTGYKHLRIQFSHQ
jgi:hypothetical protein